MDEAKQVNNTPCVAFEDVTFRRDGRQILRGINWQIGCTERWALLGLNGSGKSTLLGMIPAYTFPTSGQVSVFGHVFGRYRWENIKRRVGFVSSTLDMFTETLGGETPRKIVLSGKNQTIGLGLFDEWTPEDVSRADQLIEDFGLRKVEDSYFFNLSQGEQRRTLLARALMHDPDLLVLDEPCASLDVRARELVLDTLTWLAEQHTRPFIYVTHTIDEIIPCISHVAILEEGVIVAQGEKRQVLTDENLSRLAGCPARVHWEQDRPFMIIQ